MRHFYCWVIFHMIQWSQGDWHPWEGPGFGCLAAPNELIVLGIGSGSLRCKTTMALGVPRGPWWINSQAQHLAVRKYHTALPSQSIYCWDHDHVEEWISVQVMVRCFNLQAETRILDVNNACPPLLISCCPYHLTIYSWSNPPKPVDLEKSYYHCHYHSSFTETPPGDFV